MPYPVSVRVRALADAPEKPLLVYLHGMGEDAASFETYWPAVDALGLNAVVPSGPFPFEQRRDAGISIGHAWYLYDGGPILFQETAALVRDHLQRLITRVEQEHHLRPSRRVLLGYSMGAYFGYQVALGNPGLFSHLVGVSGNLKAEPVAEGLREGHKMRCLVVHGREDRSVPADFARETHRVLTEHGFPADLELLPGGHGIRKDRDATVARWLSREFDLSGSSR